MRKLYFLVGFIFFLLPGNAQKIVPIISDEYNYIYPVDPNFLNDSIQFNNFLIQLKNSYIQQGFLEFSIDSISASREKYKVFVHRGKPFFIGDVRISNNSIWDGVEDDYLQYSGVPLGDNWKSLLKKKLKEYENHGYPFAEVMVDDVQLSDSLVDFFTHIEPRKYVVVDSLVVKANDKIESKLVAKIIEIKPGDYYNERLIKEIDQKINRNEYYQTKKKSEVLFTDKGAQLYLYLKKISRNKFDGIIGFQPQKDDAKISFTGNLNFEFGNNFQRGEYFSLDWKKLPEKTQELNLNAAYPYLGFSDVGILGKLAIFKQDSTFISLEKKMGLSYRFSIKEEISVFIEKYNSFDQNLGSNMNSGSSQATLVGVGWQKEALNNPIIPTRGYFIRVHYSVGNRKILGAEKQEFVQHRSKAELVKIIPIYKGFNFLCRMQESFQTGGQNFERELIPFGGINSLRGFDEKSLRATTLIASTLSLRYFIDSSTFLQLFYDQAWYERNSTAGFVSDSPFGIGAGFSFLTQAGVLRFSYAIGSQFDNPLEFRSGKVHFGLAAEF